MTSSLSVGPVVSFDSGVDKENVGPTTGAVHILASTGLHSKASRPVLGRRDNIQTVEFPSAEKSSLQKPGMLKPRRLETPQPGGKRAETTSSVQVEQGLRTAAYIINMFHTASNTHCHQRSLSDCAGM